MIAFAKALEVIPRQICDNAGLDATDILNKLRVKHAGGEKWFGVDVDGTSGVRDNMDAFVWEPSLVKLNAISSAAEAASLILSVDETVRNPQSEQVRRHFCLPELQVLSKQRSYSKTQGRKHLLGRRSEHCVVGDEECRDDEILPIEEPFELVRYCNSSNSRMQSADMIRRRR